MMTKLSQRDIGCDIAADPTAEKWSKQVEGELSSVWTKMTKTEYGCEQTPEKNPKLE